MRKPEVFRDGDKFRGENSGKIYTYSAATARLVREDGPTFAPETMTWNNLEPISTSSVLDWPEK
jgi:hypothetical protein